MSALEHNHEFLVQNFFKDSSLVSRLLNLSSIGQNDLVYEIGAGKGIHTAGLAQRCQQLIAVEKDPRLAAWLRQRFASSPGVTIVQADFLDLRLPDEPYKVFANIPFNCTAAIVEKLTRAAQPPLETCPVMQHEAAAVCCGAPRETLRAVLLKPFFTLEIVHHFDRRDFNPPPGVDAVLLRLRKQQTPLIRRGRQTLFHDFAVFAFTGWRANVAQTLRHLFTPTQLKILQRQHKLNLQSTPTQVPFEH